VGPSPVGSEIVQRILDNPDLPNPARQADNLILYLGDTLVPVGPGGDVMIGPAQQALIGARRSQDIAWIMDHLLDEELIEEVPRPSQRQRNVVPRHVRLTFRGWERYESLQRGVADSRKAFMAMPFNDARLDRIFRDCFRPAVKATGFELVRLDDTPKAGLIDDRLRVEIRTSRFLVAELSGENANVYWEAGFAEGLGKPVIYTCEHALFEEKSRFDTSHHLHVLWNEDRLAQAAEDLKASIRATMPTDAKLVDG
jgi:hypothetical protein